MHTSVPALIPLSLLEAVQNIDTPRDDGLGALEDELASKRLGLSPTVAAQVERYRRAAELGDAVHGDEAQAVFTLVGRRPDADLVYADAGRRAARLAAKQRSGGNKALSVVSPGKLGLSVRLRSAADLSRRWLMLELTPSDGLARAITEESMPLVARPDGVACRFYTAAFAELLRLVAGIEGAMVHEACRGQGDRHCIWRAQRAQGYE